MKKVVSLFLFFWGIYSFAGINHNPPNSIPPERDFLISYTIDEYKDIEYSKVYFRKRGGISYRSVFATKTGKLFEAIIPGDQITFPAIEYYITVTYTNGQTQDVFGTESNPQMIPVIEGALRRDPQEQVFRSKWESLEVFSQEDIVISASRREQRVIESPSVISVVTQEDIENYGSESLADVLRIVPGVNMMRITPCDPEISIRGFNREGSNKILTMVDGRSIYVDLFGMTFWEFLPISVHDIKRVEVIRGPGSTMYGANAFSGVISIFTKGGEDIKGSRFYVSGGENGIYYTLQSGDANDNYSYRVSTSFRNLFSYEKRFNSDGQNYTGDGVVDYKLTKGTLRLGGGYIKSRAEEVFSLIGPVGVDAYQLYVHSSYMVNDFNVSLWYLFINAGLDVDFPFPKILVLNNIPNIPNGTEVDMSGLKFDMPLVHGVSNTFNIEAQNNFKIFTNNNLLIGGNYRLITFDSEQLKPGYQRFYQHLVGAFLQDEYKPVKQIIFNVGIRFDMQDVRDENPKIKDEKNRYNFSPRASFTFLPFNEHYVRLSVGTAFRNPAFFESDIRTVIVPEGDKYLKANLGGTGTIVNQPVSKTGIDYYGNRELDPEQIITVDLGYGGRLLNRLKVNLDIFYEQLKDLILFSGSVQNFVRALDVNNKDPDIVNKIFNFYNLADAQSYGFEFSIDYQITKWLKLFSNYSFQKIDLMNKEKIKEKLGISNDDDLPSVDEENPMHKINAGINLLVNKFSYNVYGHYVSKTRRENFITNMAQEQITMNISGTNVQKTLRELSKEPTFGTSDVPDYFILNMNMSYLFFNKIKFGLGVENLLGTSDDLTNDGFVFSSHNVVSKLQSGRHIEYPRLKLFGKIIGGASIPRRFYGFLSINF
ncbi:MAG: TonB-dependent receptor [Deltaproteobacteria bacterium]|nr:TonB-dependent receptor [Deltaproteobacteria bacterium]